MMEPKKFAAALLVLVLVTGTGTAGAEERSKDDRIRELMEITGAVALAEQSMMQMLPVIFDGYWKLIKQLYPEPPAQLLTLVEEEVILVMREKLPDFIESVIEVYSRYYTITEINELIAFYETDLGRKVIRVMPELTAETTAMGTEWGRNLGPLVSERVRDRLRQEGYFE